MKKIIIVGIDRDTPLLHGMLQQTPVEVNDLEDKESSSSKLTNEEVVLLTAISEEMIEAYFN